MSRYNLLPIRNARVKVGILGGTFNPAHEGHRYISFEAIKRLELDYVIWLVSPQNPLKKENVKDFLNQRLELARQVKCSNKILVNDIEKYFKNCFTANTIRRIKEMHPSTDFIWIMGADNMMQIHKWYKWKQIFNRIYIAVFDRANYGLKVIRAKSANNFPLYSVPIYANKGKHKAGAWCMFRIRKSPISSTEIRSKLKDDSSN